MKSPIFALALMPAFTPMAMAEEVRVAIRDHGFVPALVTAMVGDTLALINEDRVERNVFSPTSRFAVDFGVQKPGETRRLRLGAVGAFEIEDVFASEKKLAVEVKQ